ncbi:MAG TPA: MerR family transcriptional regulator [Solirubrobacteraceae bacterium]|jgi:DNA-binding transcriptional MerR regulator|nr:MerR family transcriptional regulator [Solirubrobacteraceae bacterium]
MAERVHGRLLAGEAGEIVGVSGTTIGQWARHGYIRPSQSADLPHVYAVEDVGEAAIVAALLHRGVRHADVRRAIDRLRSYGDWPLSEARLATTRTADGARPRIVLEEDGRRFLLTDRGWQVLAIAPETDEVRLRLRPAA